MSTNKQIAGILLAAGGSKRMGQPKLLMEWHGAPLVRWVARMGLAAGCSPLVVVTGANASLLESCLSGLSLQFVHNPDWERGQSSSVRAGVNALPSEVDAAIILLADQPQIPVQVAVEIMSHYRQNPQEGAIWAASINGKRGNPVLFDRALFPTLTSLEGDAGARSILSNYPVQLVSFDDTELLLDVDSEADYQYLLQSPPPNFPD